MLRVLAVLLCALFVLTSNIVLADDKAKTKTEPDPVILKGSGQQASSKFPLEKGLSVFSMSHKGDANFIIKLLNDEGGLVELLVNRIGDFKGSKAVRIESKGTYIMDILADGNWTIEIHQPRPSSAKAIKSFSGDNAEATQPFHLKKGLSVFKMKHAGDGNFIPKLMDKDGKLIELLANVIGPFDGSKAVRVPSDGIYILNVEANGKWSIAID